MNFLRTIAIVWAAGCLSLGAWVSHMVFFDNTPPYIWDGGPPDGLSYIAPQPAEQQSMVTANWRMLQINRICPATLQRFFRDPNADNRLLTTLDTTPASRSVQQGDLFVPRSFELPPNMPAEVDYSVLACFECNLYQKFIEPLCIPTPTIRFSVKPYPKKN